MRRIPIYSYWCRACDTDVEKMSSIVDRDGQFCESCGNRLVRGIDRPGLVWSPSRTGVSHS